MGSLVRRRVRRPSCTGHNGELRSRRQHQRRGAAMHARTGRVSFSPDKADEMVSHVRDTIVPNYESSEGFKGFTLLLDRSSGQGIGISFWTSEETRKEQDRRCAQTRTCNYEDSTE